MSGKAISTVSWLAPIVTSKLTPTHCIAIGVSTAALLTAKVFAPSAVAASLRDGRGVGGHRKGETSIGINRRFLRHFLKLLRIAFPRLQSLQGLHLAVLSIVLLLRTVLTLKIASLTGILGRRMVQAEVRPFAVAVLTFGAWSIPTSAVNSGLKYFTALLQSAMRCNLTEHFHRRYLSSELFFRYVGTQDPQNPDPVDQRIAQDVAKFSDSAADIYATLFKPILDIFLLSNRIARHAGWLTPLWIISYYASITFLVRILAPNYAVLTAEKQKREAELRSNHATIMHFAEEITIAQGEATTLKRMNSLFGSVYAQAMHIAYMKAKNKLLDGIMVKFGSVMVANAVIAISIFSREASDLGPSELTGLFMYTQTLLINLAQAIGRLILSYKTVSSLAGYTHRVYELEDGLNAIERSIRAARAAAVEAAAAAAISPPDRGASLSSAGDVRPTTSSSCTGEVRIRPDISFNDVPIVAPDGTLLLKSLSFHVKPGMNLLIVGPNGCGKTSTFRFLGELWPLRSGIIEKPSHDKLYYVPQRPYMSSGSLRDQVIYPMQAKELKVGESELFKCLERAQLGYLLDKQDVSWDARLNWAGEALSHGEKQKMAMARLFFHKPRFAILDECSSAIDTDVEEKLYMECEAQGITLITIAHRRSVWRYHNWVLRFDGNGGYMFSPLSFSPGGDFLLDKVVSSSDETLLGAAVRVRIASAKGETMDDGGNAATDEVSVTREQQQRVDSAPSPMSAPRIPVVRSGSSMMMMPRQESSYNCPTPPNSPAAVGGSISKGQNILL